MVIGLLMFIIMSAFLLVEMIKGLKVNKTVIFFFLLLLTFYSWQLLYHSDDVYLTRLRMVFMMLFLYFYISNVVGIDAFVKVYVYMLVVILVSAAIATPLIMLNILKPFFEYISLDGRTGYYFGLTNSVVYYPFSNFSFVRVSGVFDEPGALNTWGIYALILNKAYLKNPKIEKILIIALCFVFSLAFYLIIIVYYILFYVKINLKNVTLLLTTVFLIIFVYSLKGTDHNIVYTETIGRLELGRDGYFAGDSRTKLAEAAFEYFKTAPWLGIGQGTFDDISNSGHFMHANIIAILASNGIIGFFVLPFLFWALVFDGIKKLFTSDLIKYLVLILLLFLQRPEVEYVFSIIMLTVTFEALKRKDVIKI